MGCLERSVRDDGSRRLSARGVPARSELDDDGSIAIPPWRCSVLYQGKNVRQKAIAAVMSRPGKPGWYFRVLNCASGCRRHLGAAERVTPRSASVVRCIWSSARRDRKRSPGAGRRHRPGSPGRPHPADRVAFEPRRDRSRPLRRPQQLGDVGLVRRRGHQLGLGVPGMLTLIAPLPDRLIGGQDPIVRSEHRLALVEQRRHDFRRRAIHEAWAGEHIELTCGVSARDLPEPASRIVAEHGNFSLHVQDRVRGVRCRRATCAPARAPSRAEFRPRFFAANSRSEPLRRVRQAVRWELSAPRGEAADPPRRAVCSDPPSRIPADTPR